VGKSPAFRFYPADFLADIKVASMSMEERGIYITLLCHCWLENGLPVDSTLAKTLLICNESVASCFYEKNGKFRNKRLDLEKKNQKAWIKKCSQGGLARAKAQLKLKGSSSKAQVNPCISLSSSSSLSSSIKNPPAPLPNPDIHIEAIQQVFDHFNYHVHPEKPLKVGDPECDRGMRYANERLSDGYGVADLYHVIEVMTEAWTGDLQMRRYLRPEVLFSKAKFAGYLARRTHAQEGKAWAADMTAKQEEKP